MFTGAKGSAHLSIECEKEVITEGAQFRGNKMCSTSLFFIKIMDKEWSRPNQQGSMSRLRAASYAQGSGSVLHKPCDFTPSPIADIISKTLTEMEDDL